MAISKRIQRELEILCNTRTTRAYFHVLYYPSNLRDIEKFLRKFLNRPFELKNDVEILLMNIRDVMEYFCEIHLRWDVSLLLLYDTNWLYNSLVPWQTSTKGLTLNKKFRFDLAERGIERMHFVLVRAGRMGGDARTAIASREYLSRASHNSLRKLLLSFAAGFVLSRWCAGARPCDAPQRRMMDDANLGARIMAASGEGGGGSKHFWIRRKTLLPYRDTNSPGTNDVAYANPLTAESAKGRRCAISTYFITNKLCSLRITAL